jgi:hypothetical protein
LGVVARAVITSRAATAVALDAIGTTDALQLVRSASASAVPAAPHS